MNWGFYLALSGFALLLSIRLALPEVKPAGDHLAAAAEPAADGGAPEGSLSLPVVATLPMTRST